MTRVVHLCAHAQHVRCQPSIHSDKLCRRIIFAALPAIAVTYILATSNGVDVHGAYGISSFLPTLNTTAPSLRCTRMCARMFARCPTSEAVCKTHCTSAALRERDCEYERAHFEVALALGFGAGLAWVLWDVIAELSWKHLSCTTVTKRNMWCAVLGWCVFIIVMRAAQERAEGETKPDARLHSCLGSSSFSQHDKFTPASSILDAHGRTDWCKLQCIRPRTLGLTTDVEHAESMTACFRECNTKMSERYDTCVPSSTTMWYPLRNAVWLMGAAWLLCWGGPTFACFGTAWLVYHNWRDN